ncbi:hypothetical protein [Phenylobacterium sp.]|uniref:hypothetical protein n=1 Tax=Phenylobacterium sp. TaxID=1871053 RepID=UPI002F95C801
MSEPPPPAKKRLPIRWLALSEIVAVAAVVIAALGYWDSHRERGQEAREKAAAARERQAEQRAAQARQAFLLKGTVEGSGERIRLEPVNEGQVIQTQTVIFPTPVRDDEVETTGNPRVERRWFDAGLKKARRKGAETGRMPVGVVTTYIQDGQTRSDHAIYMLGYSLEDRMLRGDEVKLDGLSFARRVGSGDLQKSVDALWEGAR